MKITHSIHRASVGSRKSYEIPFSTFSFAKIVASYYDLPPIIVDSIIYRLTLLYQGKYLFRARQENKVIAVTIYEARKSKMPRFENFDASGFIKRLYKPENIRKQTINIYSIVQKIEELF